VGDLVLCLFCGAGGSTLGIHAAMPDADIVGIDNDRDSCLTHQAAGFPTIRADLATLPKEPFVGKVTGLWASPPCTDFSRAGKRAGVDGETGKLIYCAMDWARTLTPPWVVFEQVPEVLAYWERFAERSVGYWTWTGILNLANFGVPQTRERAFLLASRLGPVFPPEPTHAQHPHPSLFGPQRRPWMSMADALGWLETDQLEQIRGSGMTERHGTRPTRKGSELAFTVTAPRRWKHHVLQTNRGQDEQGAIKVTLAEVARLQDFPDGYPFKGNKRSVGRQIGNAVPPALAEACVRAVVRSRAPVDDLPDDFDAEAFDVMHTPGGDIALPKGCAP
jgi:DNA (cytosine-5)-methyltransferase 1